MKCKICGSEIRLINERRYTSRDTKNTGLAAAIGGNTEPSEYDTFDCLECGCQNVVQERKRNLEDSLENN